MLKAKFLIILSVLFVSCDNETAPENVPEAVKSGLQAQFPDVRVLEWEALNQNYAAEFNIDNIPYEVLVSREGKILKYKYDILESELPEAVRATIRREYSEVPIADTEVLVYEGKKYYQAHFDDELRDYWLVFSEDGQRVDQPDYMR
ncbi:hypothetical protein [Cesiribacter sp. SM1]|uniref:hypothetical protein n=1 Tax=Cesiribacter sp. SM1 TaxID=2861196 RepID=UPI001CD5D787|nr:hypothetical protein [Cesiribacter sp. SM1]